MLLCPTINRSLLVSSHQSGAMPEKDRKKISTLFYQLEVKNGSVVIDSQKELYGIKEASRTGIVSICGKHYSIEYNTLKGYIKTGIIWREKFIFTTKPIPCDNKLTNTVEIVNSSRDALRKGGV